MARSAAPFDSSQRPEKLRPRPDWNTCRFVIVMAVLCASLNGCVYRRMAIRSDPPGALVVLDGKDVGYTPYIQDFLYYGTHEITLIKDGYETLTVMQRVPAPWYQLTPGEFFADNLSPVKVTNRHDFTYRLKGREHVPTQELLDRANMLRSESQFGP